jgi:GntR family transcriptional regulator
VISPDPEGARYKRLAALLRARIISGELSVGQRLPSEKDLKDQYGMARETIRKAVALLRSEGLVEVRQGHGTYVRGKVEAKVVKLAKGERAGARMPTPVERQDLELAEGVPIMVVTRPDGSQKFYAADATLFSG